LTIFTSFLMVALPVGIVATAFANEVHRRDFVVTWGLVARIPLFSELTAAALSYANRIHMWIDFVFPWGVTNGFPRPERREAALRSAGDQA